MKNKSNPILRSTLITTAILGLATVPGQADVQLLTDNFDTAQDGVNLNDEPGLSNDQGGTLEPIASTISYTGNRPWSIRRGFTDGGNYVSEMALIGNGTPYGDANGFNTYSSLDRNFATDANGASAPLEVKFTIKVFAGVTSSDWGAIQIGSVQNAFITAGENKFASLFRDSGGTEQWVAGTSVSNAITFTNGDLITLVLSNATGIGSAFNNDGATDVAKIYVNNTLVSTWTGLDLGAADGYISFAAHNANLAVDNLVISTLPASSDYDVWATSFTPAVGLPAADDDGDGCTNQQEYAFGLNPHSTTGHHPVTVPLDKASGTFTYTRRDPVSKSTGLTYSIWTSTDLVGWNLESETSAVQVPGVPDGNGTQSVIVTLTPPPTSPHYFIQVRSH